MPLARYFLIVGGVLIALLLVVGANPPTPQVADGAGVDLPAIRIHSDRKLPDRVVYDTSIPTIAPPQLSSSESVVSTPPAPDDVLAKARQETAFAQMQTPDARRPEAPGSRKSELVPKRKHKHARRPAMQQPAWVMARQPRFGWFGNYVW
jgi:hypothetical protein